MDGSMFEKTDKSLAKGWVTNMGLLKQAAQNWNELKPYLDGVILTDVWLAKAKRDNDPVAIKVFQRMFDDAVEQYKSAAAETEKKAA